MQKILLASIYLAVNFICSNLNGQSVLRNKTELKLNLNESGSLYIKSTLLNQTWVRFNQSNPGTLVLGDLKNQTLDIGLRRTRFQLYGQVSDHVFFYFQAGQNNFNYLAGQNSGNNGNRKNQFFVHDALAEYRIKPGSDLLHLGAGLTITNGLSRFSQPSIGTIMSMDVPVFAQATVDATDEFSRKLSVYARGQLGKLDYRFVLSDPFPITSNGQAQIPIQPDQATFSWNRHRKQFQGLFILNLLEKESCTTPYMTGTYLGKKRILNLETGFVTQRDATWSGTLSSPVYHPLSLWSLAIFADHPVGSEGAAFNGYIGYFNTNYGPGYLRYNGIMNPANGTAYSPTPSGSYGNAFPMFGTGSAVYSQIGYQLPEKITFFGVGKIMPYFTWQRSDLHRLNGLMNVTSLGFNWLIDDHRSKFTLDWQQRPVYKQVGSELIPDSRKSQILLQYQVYF
ncbi:MAG: hypothetical protein ACO3FI_02430 [Cyclobacteriaceae bacterium]